MSYVKLFDSIVASTIWMAPSETRVVWITMLAIADRDGNVMASVPGLAHLCRVSRSSCEAALAALMAPDADSRTKTNEGRRIAPIDGGWLIINYEKYRDRATLAEKQEKDRLRQQRKRDRDAASRDVTPVTLRHAPSLAVTESRLSSDLISADLSEAEKQSTQVQPKTPRAAALGPVDPRFDEFWAAYDYKKDRPASLKAWEKIKPDDALAATIVAKARETRAANPAKEFYRYPATWLNARGWEDEIVPRSNGTTTKLTASGRVVVEASKVHIPNMPLGSEFCDCPGCAAAKLTKSLSDAKNVSNHMRATP